MGSYNIAVVPANVALEVAKTSVVVVEFIDDPTTLRKGQRHAVREVVSISAEPSTDSIRDIVSTVRDIAAPLGPDARVIFNSGPSMAARYPWRDAYAPPKREFARAPRGLTIGGDGIGEDEFGLRVGEAELVQSLREMVKTKQFTLPPDGEGADVIKAAMAIEPSLTEAGRLRFPTRHRDGRVFALALALYPMLTPSHEGRRYDTPYIPSVGRSVRCESYAEAVRRFGQAAKS